MVSGFSSKRFLRRHCVLPKIDKLVLSMDGITIIGILLIGTGGLFYVRDRIASKKGFLTSGKIIEFQPDFSSFDGGTQHTREFPIVEYKDEDGELRSGEMSISHRLGRFKLGDELKILKFENSLHHPKADHIISIAIISIGIIILLLKVI